MQEFLIKEIQTDNEKAINVRKTVRGSQANIDRDDQFWKGEVDAGLKETGLKPTKNNREQLNDYMTNILGRIQKPCDSAIEANPKGL